MIQSGKLSLLCYTFRKSKLYQQKHVPVTKRGAQLEGDIKLRSQAHELAMKVSVPFQASFESTQETKLLSDQAPGPTSKYYLNVLRAFKNDNFATREHIKGNLEKLKMERSVLENARKKVNAYRAVDE